MYSQKRILITTPDFPPKLGGLSTYTVDLEKILKKINPNIDILVWTKYSEIKIEDHEMYDYIFNVNFLAGYIGNWPKSKNINIFHGSEILFYSKNIFKRIYKKIFRYKIIQYFEASKKNIFISDFTLQKLKGLGFKVNYSRDFIMHNCIDIDGSKQFKKSIELQGRIKFCCIARDVPHKNLAGVVALLELLASKYSSYQFELTLNSHSYTSSQIHINCTGNISNERREEIYKQSHFNVLLSLDHSECGYFEGFGLTCLEAAKYATPSIVSKYGGLPENVHHGLNGIVFDENKVLDFFEAFSDAIENYPQLQERCHEHLLSSHTLEAYEDFLRGVILE